MNPRTHNLRNRELAQIHVAKGQLALDDDTYRAMLWTVARVKSAGDLDFTGRKQVLEHMKARGFKPTGGTFHGKHNAEWGWVDRAAADRQPMLRKIIAILRSASPPRGREYADAMAQRMFKVERLEFADSLQLHGIISALLYDQKRRGGGR